MDRPLTNLDWSLVRAFVTVAETGSLSAAARTLGVSQPTLGRQVRSLEAALGTDLFHRHARGFAPTDTARALLPAARAMRDAAADLALAAEGRAQTLAGTVRIAASVVMSARHLPPIAAAIRAAEPGISIEIVASDVSTNLMWREADIAVRMFRPTQLDLVTRHIGDLALGFFAARAYLDRRAPPQSFTDPGHDRIGFDRNSAIVDGFAAAGHPVARDDFAVRTDDQVAYLELVRAGCGIGIVQTLIGRADPDLSELDFGITLPTLPLWLTAPQAIRATPRIARVWDMLADALADLARLDRAEPRR